MEGWLPVVRRLRAPVTGAVLALWALAAVASFAPFDPTLTTLRLPKDGIANWLGLPGALLGGSLVELFGAAALLLPLLIANYTFNAAARRGWRRYTADSLALLVLASCLIGLGGALPAPTLWGPGVAGWSAARWLRQTVGLWPGLAGVLLGCSYGLGRVLGGPVRTTAPEEGAAPAEQAPRPLRKRLLAGLGALRPPRPQVWLGGLLAPGAALLAAGAGIAVGVGGGARQLGRAARHSGNWTGRALGQGWRALDAGMGALGAGVRSGLRWVRSAARVAGSVRAIGWPRFRWPARARRPISAPASAAEPLAGVLQAAEPAPPVTDWTRAPAAARAPEGQAALPREAPIPRPPAAAPIGAGPAPAPPGLMDLDADLGARPTSREAGVERWERLLTRYRDNLDLDWDEHGWRKGGQPQPPDSGQPRQAPRPGKPGR